MKLFAVSVSSHASCVCALGAWCFLPQRSVLLELKKLTSHCPTELFRVGPSVVVTTTSLQLVNSGEETGTPRDHPLC